MAIAKPYYGIYRPCLLTTDASNEYLKDEEYFKSKNQHIMAYYLISEDLKSVFEYIEPISLHDNVYSHRLYELLLRTCTELESVFSEILIIHDYKIQKGKATSYNLNMTDYFELEKHMKLSQYTVTFREKLTLSPYLIWGGTSFQSLSWYVAYNNVKHNRFNCFAFANLINVMNALAGLHILLFAQFYNYADCFEDNNCMLLMAGSDFFVGNPPYYKLFHIKDKPTWTDSEKYDFTWATLKTNTDRFQKITF